MNVRGWSDDDGKRARLSVGRAWFRVSLGCIFGSFGLIVMPPPHFELGPNWVLVLSLTLICGEMDEQVTFLCSLQNFAGALWLHVMLDLGSFIYGDAKSFSVEDLQPTISLVAVV